MRGRPRDRRAQRLVVGANPARYYPNMTSRSALVTTAYAPSGSAAPPSADVVAALGEAIADLAARLHAATYELLVLLQQFDAQRGWSSGFASCAHWLHWRTGIDLGAAREKVRVARAVAALPLVSEAMARGELSYAKVRAITRVATPDTEVRLLDLARAATAAQVERLVAAWRGVDRTVTRADATARHQGRFLSLTVEDDGMVAIRGRLTPELAAIVQRAIDAATDRLWREAADRSRGDRVPTGVSAGQRRADALARLAEAALAGELDPGAAADRYQVVLHIDAESPRPADTTMVATEVRASSTHARSGVVAIEGAHMGARPMPAPAGVLEIGAAAVRVSAETSQRVACDAAVVAVTHDCAGAVLDVGRRTRTIPAAIRRALQVRDRHCQFPGCTARRCDAHHLVHWFDGGPTSVTNLVLLCRVHHRAVHDDGFSVRRDAGGALVFHTPAGRPLPAVPAMPGWQAPLARDTDSRTAVDDRHPLAPTVQRLAARGISPGARSLTLHDGSPLRLGYAIDVLYVAPAAVRDADPMPRTSRRGFDTRPG